MSARWNDATPPEVRTLGAIDWLRASLRGAVLALLVFGGLALLLTVRLIERPFCGLHRPVTPYITQAVCRAALRVLGITLRVTGAPAPVQGAVVANHSSWLDIFVLNAAKRIYFVSKSEVAGWPGIGWLARATGTVFIERNPSRAAAQTQMFQDRLEAGHKLLFFPEGTSTDNMQVIAFKTTLFQSFFAPALRSHLAVQPVSVHYMAPADREARFYGWWGDMTFGAHLLATLAPARQGCVRVMYHPPLNVADYTDRKALARACETAVRTGHADLARQALL